MKVLSSKKLQYLPSSFQQFLHVLYKEGATFGLPCEAVDILTVDSLPTSNHERGYEDSTQSTRGSAAYLALPGAAKWCAQSYVLIHLLELRHAGMYVRIFSICKLYIWTVPGDPYSMMDSINQSRLNYNYQPRYFSGTMGSASGTYSIKLQTLF